MSLTRRDSIGLVAASLATPDIAAAAVPPQPMRLVRSIPDMRGAIAAGRGRYGSLALMVTLGALHEGHGALVRAAVASGAAVMTMIIVHPSVVEDMARDPGDTDQDLAALSDWGCTIAWLADPDDAFPPGAAATVAVGGPALGWEADLRPRFFPAVATLFSRVFALVQPDRVYLGEKDWQQLQVCTGLVADLGHLVEVVGVPTVREPDGLALSSRNRFLTAGQRRLAPQLNRTLREVASALASGPAAPVLAAARATLVAQGFAVDYLALVDGATMLPLAERRPGARLIASARLGGVRLTDNIAA